MYNRNHLRMLTFITISAGIETAVPLMHKSTYHICNEFLGLLPNALFHSFMHILLHMNMQLQGLDLTL
jgi:hypothetical protein